MRSRTAIVVIGVGLLVLVLVLVARTLRIDARVGAAADTARLPTEPTEATPTRVELVAPAAPIAQDPAASRDERPKDVGAERVEPPRAAASAGDPLSITGRVIDAQGRGLRGARVRLLDPPQEDELARGEPRMDDLRARARRLASNLTCDVEGRFAFEGLVPRAYRIEALDPITLALATTPPIEAGTRAMRIELNTTDLYPCLAGRLVGRNGTPIVDRRVVACRPIEHGNVNTAETRTDEAGRFRFADVSKEATLIAVFLDRAAERTFRIADQPDPCAMEIVVPQLLDLGILLETSTIDADAFAMLDPSGKRVKLAQPFGQSGWKGPYDTLPLSRTEPMWIVVPDDTKTIVLLKANQELERRDVIGTPGEKTTVRL